MYAALCKAFASEPFEAAYAKCREYERKYYSCWNVQLHIGLLYVNHAMLAGENMTAVLEEAIRLFRTRGKGRRRVKPLRGMQSACRATAALR